MGVVVPMVDGRSLVIWDAETMYAHDFAVPAEIEHYLTLVTDSHIVRGTFHSRKRRITDILNQAEHDFLVVRDASVEELGEGGVAARAAYAQVNLNSLLFAVAENSLDAQPEMRLAKSPQDAMIILPPFKLTGLIHILQEQDLFAALNQMTDRFLPLTDAEYWSDTSRVPRTEAPMVAFNHARAHILAQIQEVEPPPAPELVPPTARLGLPLRGASVWSVDGR